MILKLIRDTFTENSTQGKLLIENEFFCYTLEDKDRDLYQQTPLQDIIRSKVFGKTAIPYGTYEIGLTYSNRFNRVMPQLLDVPGFTAIRIHNGNTPEHTDGCILVGKSLGIDAIYQSRVTFSRLESILKEQATQGKISITISKTLST